MEGHQTIFCDHCGQAMEEVDINGLMPGSRYVVCVNATCIMALGVFRTISQGERVVRMH